LVFFWSLWTALIATFFLSSVSSFTCWSWGLHLLCARRERY
jgi:hypothetical protein